MQQRTSHGGIAAELSLFFPSQEQVRYLPGTLQHVVVRDEHAELPSLEELIQAVLNSNIEA